VAQCAIYVDFTIITIIYNFWRFSAEDQQRVSVINYQSSYYALWCMWS